MKLSNNPHFLLILNLGGSCSSLKSLKFHSNGLCTHTHRLPNQIHTAVTLSTSSKLVPRLPCDHSERAGTRLWLNSHLADSSEEISGESWWRSAFMAAASDEEPRLLSISWMKSKLFQIIWEERQKQPLLFCWMHKQCFPCFVGGIREVDPAKD